MTLEEFDALVSAISERAFCAGWQGDIEMDLWLITVGAHETRIAQSEVSPEELRKLREHLATERTWIVWRTDPVLVPLAEWFPLMDAFRRQFPGFTYGQKSH